MEILYISLDNGPGELLPLQPHVMAITTGGHVGGAWDVGDAVLVIWGVAVRHARCEGDPYGCVLNWRRHLHDGCHLSGLLETTVQSAAESQRRARDEPVHEKS